jgi:hypothetical protein
VWLDDLKFDVVNRSVPATGNREHAEPDAPRNTDFEEDR